MRAWLMSVCGISELSSGTSCTLPIRRIWEGFAGSGDQKAVWFTQQLSRFTFSPKPKAWNISIVRVFTPSACPFSIGPGLRSTIITSISGNRESCAARQRPAGPQPAISTSTSRGRGACGPLSRRLGAALRMSGSPPRKPSR